MTYPQFRPRRPRPTASCHAPPGVGKGQHTAVGGWSEPGRCWAGAAQAARADGCRARRNDRTASGVDGGVGVEQQHVARGQVHLGEARRFTPAANPRFSPGSMYRAPCAAATASVTGDDELSTTRAG